MSKMISMPVWVPAELKQQLEARSQSETKRLNRKVSQAELIRSALQAYLTPEGGEK